MNTNPNAKRILVYGDSFTFGKVPGGARFTASDRFTGVLQNTLGIDYEVMEEGLRGRTVSGENGFFPYRNGLEQFGPIFGSHLPLEFLILLLGTNDTNSKSDKTPKEIAEGFKLYKDKIDWWCNHLAFQIPKVILIAPPEIHEENSYKLFGEIFKGARTKSLALPTLYENLAKELSWVFLDASNLVTASTIDGVHLDKENNKILGDAIAKNILNM